MNDKLLDELINADYSPFEAPLLPLRGVLVLPHTVMQLEVGRDKSIKAIDDAVANDNTLVLSMQKDINIEDPKFEDIYEIGSLVEIKQVFRPPGGTLRVIVEGISRVKISDYVETEPFITVECAEIEEDLGGTEDEIEVLFRKVLEEFEQYGKLSKKTAPEIIAAILTVEDPSELADIVATNLTLKLGEKQEILETSSVRQRLEKMLIKLSSETELLSLDKKIGNEVKKQMDQNQKEYYLREQLKAISKELGEGEDKVNECIEYRQKIKKARMPKDIEEKVLKEVSRLEKMPPMVAEAMVVRNYLDCLLELPWRKETRDRLDLIQAEKILNDDHCGLEEVKERILEYLAVRQLAKTTKGPILCLAGPPGVGKTSLAKSIARAMNRNYLRMSLGGVHDEAEIRGHRKTYIGAMPGRIIQNLRNAKSKNPLFLLDEIDKLGNDYKGDPSSALLEVLDPEQNSTFTDHYVEVPFDLSKVMFITTANDKYNIPEPLLDRMEVIDIAGYTREEKLNIAKEHLVAKQIQENNLEDEQLIFTDDALMTIIKDYTREAGVRNLERKIGAVCRKVARLIVTGKSETVEVTSDNIGTYLGIPDYRQDKTLPEPEEGVVMGLAWTSMGGETLKVETKAMKGKGELILTGQLGDVMKESARIALSYLRSTNLELADDYLETHDIHIHVPEGAIPKDGPSAGVTITTALASILTNRKVHSHIAMTGEVTLTGRVLPVGGIKEKLLAAFEAGATTILIPYDNEKDLEKLPESVRTKLDIHLIKKVDDVLKMALI